MAQPMWKNIGTLFITVGGPCCWSLSTSCPDTLNVLVLILIRRSVPLNHKSGPGSCSFKLVKKINIFLQSFFAYRISSNTVGIFTSVLKQTDVYLPSVSNSNFFLSLESTKKRVGSGSEKNTYGSGSGTLLSTTVLKLVIFSYTGWRGNG